MIQSRTEIIQHVPKETHQDFDLLQKKNKASVSQLARVGVWGIVHDVVSLLSRDVNEIFMSD